jgi:GAF domain-containing protein
MFEEALSGLGQYFLGDLSLDATLHRVSELALRAVEPAEHVGITLTLNGSPTTAIFSHPDVPDMEAAQYQTGDGPCLDALRDDRPHLIASMREHGPWQPFRESARRHGVLSSMSLPMRTHDGPVGAMNFYSRHERAFGEREVRVGTAFARQAGFVLVNAHAYWDARTLSENLSAAMASRATIEQAKGIIIATMRCTPEEAFEVLTKQSQQQNRKLREIATEIVNNSASRRS